MQRTCLILVGALLGGCAQHNDQSSSAKPDAAAGAPTDTAAPAPTGIAGVTSHAPDPSTAPAVKVVAPNPPPVATAPIYELSQDGKIYVFAFVDHMLAFQQGKPQPVVIEKPDFTPKHTTVVIEAPDDALAGEILASYLKMHPDSKK